MKRLYVVVEGFSEEAFIKKRLLPHLLDRGVSTNPIIVTTKRERSGSKHKGGGRWTNWRNEIERIYKEHAGPDAWVTTMFDLYGLPSDFPKREVIDRMGSGAQKVVAAERALEQAVHGFSEGRWFVPFIAQHEFESLVLACLEDLGRLLDAPSELAGLAALSAEIGQTPPEEVNDNPSTAPSKRLIRHLPGYEKLLHSEYALCEVSMLTLAERCPHFGGWLARLEALAATSNEP